MFCKFKSKNIQKGKRKVCKKVYRSSRWQLRVFSLWSFETHSMHCMSKRRMQVQVTQATKKLTLNFCLHGQSVQKALQWLFSHSCACSIAQSEPAAFCQCKWCSCKYFVHRCSFLPEVGEFTFQEFSPGISYLLSKVKVTWLSLQSWLQQSMNFFDSETWFHWQIIMHQK